VDGRAALHYLETLPLHRIWQSTAGQNAVGDLGLIMEGARFDRLPFDDRAEFTCSIITFLPLSSRSRLMCRASLRPLSVRHGWQNLGNG
jgi:hypothetical protein